MLMCGKEWARASALERSVLLAMHMTENAINK